MSQHVLAPEHVTSGIVFTTQAGVENIMSNEQVS